MNSVRPCHGEHRSSKGFTLPELLVVLAIIGIASAVAAPSVASWLTNWRTKTMARQLMTDLQAARMGAIAQTCSSTVTIDALGNKYTIQVNGATVGIPRQLNAQNITVGGNTEPNPYFTPGVALGWTPATAQTTWTITFNSMGVPSFNPANVTTATISQGGAASYTLQVSPTGGITIGGGPNFAL